MNTHTEPKQFLRNQVYAPVGSPFAILYLKFVGMYISRICSHNGLCTSFFSIKRANSSHFLYMAALILTYPFGLSFIMLSSFGQLPIYGHFVRPLFRQALPKKPP